MEFGFMELITTDVHGLVHDLDAGYVDDNDRRVWATTDKFSLMRDQFTTAILITDN